MAASSHAVLAPDYVPGYATEKAADLSQPETRRRLSPAAIKGFLGIVEKWSLRDPDARVLLGGVSNGSYYGLKKESAGKALDQDTLTRISLLLGIFKALNILYSKKLADAWMTLPNTNPIFRGQTPLEYIMQRGLPGMITVRQLLDARRGGQ
ncbi:MbcA/ParS/Xre antitoxin family protein [Silvibacterium acidisoli]|uniref:MbcA/ParS/Xre antitoxin family protein n=1 Tax=Acidobacteriaceae bacterium ZG23-2 TaxID=2883246 RepID=UPI00406CC554